MKSITCNLPDSIHKALQERMESDKESCDHVVSMALSQYLGKPIHTLFQVSTSAALVEGLYQGAMRSGPQSRLRAPRRQPTCRGVDSVLRSGVGSRPYIR